MAGELFELGGVVEDLGVDEGDTDEARFGRFLMCREDQGSPFGLHQPSQATSGANGVPTSDG